MPPQPDDAEEEFWVIQLTATTLISDIASKVSDALLSNAVDAAAVRLPDCEQLVITSADVVAAAKKLGLSTYTP